MEVRLSHSAHDPRPVLAELFVRFNPEELRFTKAETLLTSKHMAAHVVNAQLLRISFTGINLKPLPNGVLATLLFERKNERAARFRFEKDLIQFAPKAAAQAIRIGPPLKVKRARR